MLMNDPRVIDIPVAESDEGLVDLEAVGIMRFSDRKRLINPHIAFVRVGVAERLRLAVSLLPEGLQFLGIEAYRPSALQEEFYRSYEAKLLASNPGLNGPELASLTSRFVSPPAVAPHPSGAAIDLTLADLDGAELDLGSAVDATPEASGGACYTDAPGLSAECAANRGILAATLSAAGLVNYPTEWWHWSFGDRYWAAATATRDALYGPVVSTVPL